jgi:hypothetical protein
MKVRLGSASLVVAVVSALFLVSVLPGVVSAAPTPALTPGSTYTVWAYGVVRTVTFSGSSTDGYDFQGSATYGYTVLLNQTNLTSTTFELFANRTMAAQLSVEYCLPNCNKPTATATVTHDAWEAVDAWANFTTVANVSENGQNVSAIGLLNDHSTVRGNLWDDAQGVVRSSFVSANISANAAVTFATPLGLLPNNLTAGASWSDSSAFSASGSWAADYHYQFSGPKGKIDIGPSSSSGAVQGSGEVSVAGSVATGPDSSVTFGGVPYLNVSLTVVGPFAVREGFILVPDPVDLFGASSSTAWGSNETAGATVEMTSLYVHAGRDAHLGIGGSEWLYTSSAINPSVTSLSLGGTGFASGDELAAGANSVGSTPVQGVPISVDQANGYSNCLISGGGCPSASSGRPAVPGLFLGVIAVVVVGVVAAVLISERRRIPPPSYPNALLYPPGGTAPAPPLDPSRNGARRPTPPEDDPLSNLW